MKAFWTSKRHKYLLAFECPGPDKNRIYSIQLSGNPSPGETSFRGISLRESGIGGISLGATESDVIKALGTPSERKVYEDEGFEYTLLKYSGKNYSVELNKDGVVVSIKIIGFEGFPDRPTGVPTTEPLLRAIKRGDLRAFESLLAPNFEIYRGKKVIDYKGPATEELTSNSELKEALLGDKGLKGALAGKGAEGDSQIRIAEKGDCAAVCSVIKFPDNPLLQEIVFTPYAGSWRVYEITFKH